VGAVDGGVDDTGGAVDGGIVVAGVVVEVDVVVVPSSRADTDEWPPAPHALSTSAATRPPVMREILEILEIMGGRTRVEPLDQSGNGSDRGRRCQ
jgi:hypothetical protein